MMSQIMDLPPDVETEVIRDAAEFDALEQEWNELVSHADCSVFQSFPWLRIWWSHLGEDFPSRELHLVVLRVKGKLAVIGPFYVQSDKISALAQTRELRFLGDGLSDYCDVIWNPGLGESALRAMAHHVTVLWKQLDSVSLSEIPDGSPTARIFHEELAKAGVAARLEMSDICPRKEMSATWAETLETLGGDQRRQLQKRCRQLAEVFPVEYETINDPLVLADAMSDFIRLHQQRMEETGKEGVFSAFRHEDFHRDVCAELCKQGWLFLSFLKINGRRVAAACSYLFKDRICFHVGGLGDVGDARKHSPGIVLHAYCMQEAIRRGAKSYDFLRGTEEYKYRLGAVDFPNWRVSAKRVRLRVRILGFVGCLLGKIRRVLIPRRPVER
jgi:CelD/BcsL family acetyltransferase involved in cellulose biosynthesis